MIQFVSKFRTKQLDLNKIMGTMYAAVFFIGVQNALSVQQVVSTERTVFYRERAAGMYSAFPYTFGQVTWFYRFLLLMYYKLYVLAKQNKFDLFFMGICR